MPVIALQNFAGMMPMKDKSVLPENMADYCSDAFLYAGTVQGFREANPVHTIQNPGISSVYRIPRTNNPVPDFENSLWLEFYDPYMAVARAPVLEDQFKRYYFFPSDKAAANNGPYYNTLVRLESGLPPYQLGVPTPETAPVINCKGGTSDVQEVRSYVYTWVTLYGEEGPPSPPATLQGNVNGTWNVHGFHPTTGQRAQAPLVSCNIYRTVTGSDGTANYYLAGNVPLTATGFADNWANSDITGNIILPSTTWTPPPADLQGVVNMANGMLVGWSNERELWFCEPYRPHAWPAAYAVVVNAPIVRLAAIGQSVVVLTTGMPWIATGATPSTVTMGRIETREPCISRGSVCPAGEGAYYASPNGVILVNTMGTTNVTQLFIDKEHWSRMGIENFAASKYSAAYVAFVKGSKLHDNGIAIDHQTQNSLFTFLSTGQEVVNVYLDEFSGSTFIVTDTEVIEWNPSQIDSVLPYKWRSREWRFPKVQSFIGGEVYFDVPDVIDIPVPTSATRNTSQNQDFDPTKQYLLLKVFADGRLVYVRELIQSGELILFPSGFKATYWQFQFEG